MGLLGDLFKEVATEIGNAVMESVNEVFLDNNNVEDYDDENDPQVDAYKESMNNVSLDTLYEMAINTDGNYDPAMCSAAKQTISERKELANSVFESPEDNMFADLLEDLDDRQFAKFYSEYMGKVESLYNQDANYVADFLKNKLNERRVAKGLYYELKKEECEGKDYPDLEEIITGKSVQYDQVYKKAAQEELDDRDEMINRALSEELCEMDNNDFLEILYLAKSDTLCYSNIPGELFRKDGKYRYFGEYRNPVLHKCIQEFCKNRKFLHAQYIEEYCEDIFEDYSQKSTRYLENKFDTIKKNMDNGILIGEDFDCIDFLILGVILKYRKEEE